MFRRLILMGFLCLGLAACATPHTLTSEQVSALGITQINVTVPPQTPLLWATESERFKKTQAASPEMVTEHLRQQLKNLVQKTYELKLKPSFQGTHKVSLNVTVRALTIPSAAHRFFTDDVARFRADFEIIDNKTGTVLARFEDVSGKEIKIARGAIVPLSVIAGLSFDDPAPVVIMGNANIARDWLANGK